MTIGIDVDDTITNSYDEIINRIALYYNLNVLELKNSGVSYYEIKDDKKKYPNYDEFTKNNFEDIMKNVSIKDNACEVINNLHNEGFKIYIVTARNKKEYSMPYTYTYEYLINNNIYFDKLIVSSFEKGKTCLENKIDILIDDNVDNCVSARNSGVKTLLFDNVFNKQNNEFERVYSWYEIYKKIHEIDNKKRE